jgi:hypothetical protein
MASSLDKYSKYEPVDDSFSSSDLNRSYWIVTHKVLLRNLAIAFLMVLDIFLFVYALSGFVEYLISGRPREEAMIIDIANRLNTSTAERQKNSAALPLDFGDGRVYVFDAGNDKYDFAVEATNPNKEWYVMVTYQFDIPGATSTAARTTFLLPGEKKFLAVLGERRDGELITDGSFKIVNTMWSRIDKHQVADAPAFVAEHASFTIGNSEFAQAGTFTVDGGVENTGNRVSFSITNTSPYNFWVVPVQIALMRGGSLEGIEETQVRELKTGETRNVDLRNYVKNQLVDEVVAAPSVDVFDPSVYMEQ